ncbi:serine protease [Bosea sp. (in: a-proteobacteria)]|uniref:serine protease n=1 Tax=Bosea sp. (in: a-proteobacteria) TaxID=1871050 RepID=UPI00273302A6|nr:serine protease [Bosea sp. (in: a-proteobacteria)]MDP3254841.1 serine protease [Bosea sp. (in: a-proteobacteria)]
MRARSLRLIMSAALMLPFCAVLSVGALAQAPASAANPQLAAGQAGFESLPEPERRAIQADLIWSGHFNGAVSGSYGPLTFRAINAFKAGKGAPDGVLTPSERRSLAQAAQAAREAAGFRVIADERTGLRIGIPTAVLPKRDVSPSGSRWQSADGKITLDTSATPPGETLEAVYEKATAPTPNNPGRKITYKLLRPDFFVVTGETPTGKFYRRLAAGPTGLRGFSVGYDKALSGTVDKLVIAIAASFEPFPGGPLPAASAVASVPAAPVAATAAAVAPLRPTQRHGVAVAVADRVVATAAAAIEGCRSLQVGGRAAQLRGTPQGGITLLEVQGGAALPVPPVRREALGEGEPLLLLAFGDEGGRRVSLALPGQSVTIGSASAVSAPLQPGQAGSPVFDRQGRLSGVVTGNPSDKVLVAGVAPQRSYAVADGSALQDHAARSGLPPRTPAAAGPDLSTGAIVETVAASVLPIACAL